MERGLDHIVIGCEDLDSGTAWLTDRLGIAPDPGGQHAMMGTHNRLLSLGPGEYLELIAIDPDAPAPGRPRWFGLDGFSGPPRMIAWVARDGGAGPAPEGTEWARMTRGQLAWDITLPTSAAMPGDGATPMLIRWQDGGHPSDRLPDRGLRLGSLQISHPVATPAVTDPRIRLTVAPPALSAQIITPDGREVTL